MKKVCSLMLTLSLLLSASASAEKAELEKFTSGEYIYILLEDGTAEISRYKRNDYYAAVTIPEELDGHPVTSIGEGVFRYNHLQGVVIPEGVTAIGNNAFRECKSLKSVTLPSSLKTIGDWAFAYCEKLHEIDLPEHLTSIGEDAFVNCFQLISITIPENVTSIGEAAFYRCEHLQTVNIPKAVSVIEDYTFYLCRQLPAIVIPEGVTSVGEKAFFACRSLTEVVIPDSVTFIGPGAFCQCENLSSIRMPSGQAEVGEDAFKDTAYSAAVKEMIPESFEGAEDFRNTDYTFPDGKKLFTESAYIYSMLPAELRTLDSREADYVLAKKIGFESRNDYTGSASDTVTRMYLCGKDGTVLLLCSISHSPPAFGRVRIGGSLTGSAASDQEIWGKIRRFFPAAETAE